MRISPKFNLLNLAGFALGAGLSLVMLFLLAACAGSPRWSDSSRHPTAAQIQAVLGRQDRYVYFPGYEIYCNTAKDQYVFWRDGAWVTHFEPPAGISAEELRASPSVAMEFDDAPARHHDAVLRQYPRNWGRSGAVMLSAQ